MARTWKEIRAKAMASDRLDEQRIAKHKDRAVAEVRAHRLAEIRDIYGLKQQVVATRLGISQAGVSRIERGDIDRTKVATLRDYIQALGGDLEITARVGDERITIG